MSATSGARSIPPVVSDVALAASACALDVLLYSDAVSGDRAPEQMRFSIAYVAIEFVVLLLRRRAPATVFAVAFAHSVLAKFLSGFDFWPMVGLYLALFTVAVHRPTRVAVVVLVAAQAHAAWIAVLDLASATPRPVLVVVAVFTYMAVQSFAVWAAGRWIRTSREHAGMLEARREWEARQAVAEERARIARELHDVVSHSVTVMVLQAAGGRRVFGHDPVRAERAFGTIEEVGEQAMSELRRMLDVLRTDNADQVFERLPGVDSVPHLVESVGATGPAVRLHVVGEPRPVAPSVGLAVYRVVQEALTNVAKHSGPRATADVRLTWTADRIEIVVTDDGRDASPPRRDLSTGHGLTGLRERLAVLGGQLTAGPLPGGGFCLHAVLPVHDPLPAAADRYDAGPSDATTGPGTR